jgi:hypothetical protein
MFAMFTQKSLILMDKSLDFVSNYLVYKLVQELGAVPVWLGQEGSLDILVSSVIQV